MKEKHDWQKMREEYTQGIIEDNRVRYPTLEEVATRNNCSTVYIREKAAKENWTEQKNIYLTKLEQKRAEAKATKLDEPILFRIVDVDAKEN